MIIDFIAAWRFSFVMSSSSKVLTSHLKGVYCRELFSQCFEVVAVYHIYCSFSSWELPDTSLAVMWVSNGWVSKENFRSKQGDICDAQD